MKTMKYIATVLMLFSMTSCELERLDYTEISPENFFKTETDLKLAVNSLYYDFNPGDFKSVYSADYSGYQIIGDMTTDVLWSCWAWESDELYFQQWYATVGGSIQNHAYSNFERYNFLSKARNTIRRIENSPVSEEAKTLYSGEAKALRGWMGLYLYDMFGPVPVAPDEVLDDPQTFVYLPRLTEEEYDTMMETDLRDAIRDLPEVAEARGRMTKGAARMILLKYYMIKGYFEKAEILARELMEMEGRVYSLQPDYNYVFSKEGIGNNEVILQLACNSTASWYSNYMTAEVLPADYPWAEKATGWGGYVMPWDFYGTFEEGDSRLKNVVTGYTNKKGEKIDRTNSSQLAKGALPLKYGMDPDMKDAQSGVDVVIYRYSDVLLTLAECINRNEGSPTTEAIGLVNRVRNRAGLSALDDSQTASKETFNEALLLERGHEFYLEGLRRQDLVRFGKYVEYANARIDAINRSEGRGYFNVHEGHNRFWIPQSFIDESKGAIKQNNYDR